MASSRWARDPDTGEVIVSRSYTAPGFSTKFSGEGENQLTGRVHIPHPRGQYNENLSGTPSVPVYFNTDAEDPSKASIGFTLLVPGRPIGERTQLYVFKEFDMVSGTEGPAKIVGPMVEEQMDSLMRTPETKRHAMAEIGKIHPQGEAVFAALFKGFYNLGFTPNPQEGFPLKPAEMRRFGDLMNLCDSKLPRTITQGNPYAVLDGTDLMPPLLAPPEGRIAPRRRDTS